jgi:hypothetical protein
LLVKQGSVELELSFADGTERTFVVPPPQATLILHFQNDGDASTATATTTAAAAAAVEDTSAEDDSSECESHNTLFARYDLKYATCCCVCTLVY